MNKQAIHIPNTLNTRERVTATYKLTLCIKRGERISPCMICPPSKGKIGSRFRTVHQKETAIILQKNTRGIYENSNNDSPGITLNKKYRLR